MASNPDFVQYIADQCAGAGEITVKKMFGDYNANYIRTVITQQVRFEPAALLLI